MVAKTVKVLTFRDTRAWWERLLRPRQEQDNARLQEFAEAMVIGSVKIFYLRPGLEVSAQEITIEV